MVNSLLSVFSSFPKKVHHEGPRKRAFFMGDKVRDPQAPEGVCCASVDTRVSQCLAPAFCFLANQQGGLGVIAHAAFHSRFFQLLWQLAAVDESPP